MKLRSVAGPRPQLREAALNTGVQQTTDNGPLGALANVDQFGIVASAARHDERGTDARLQAAHTGSASCTCPLCYSYSNFTN
ncbi:hypothetical protein ACLKA6_009427 [Drosophila palustris]